MLTQHTPQARPGAMPDSRTLARCPWTPRQIDRGIDDLFGIGGVIRLCLQTLTAMDTNDNIPDYVRSDLFDIRTSLNLVANRADASIEFLEAIKTGDDL